MHKMDIRRAALFAGGFLGIWLFARYLLPVCLPFLVGLLLALAASLGRDTVIPEIKLPGQNYTYTEPTT